LRTFDERAITHRRSPGAMGERKHRNVHMTHALQGDDEAKRESEAVMGQMRRFKE
jgi:hypothetical protein